MRARYAAGGTGARRLAHLVVRRRTLYEREFGDLGELKIALSFTLSSASTASRAVADVDGREEDEEREEYEQRIGPHRGAVVARDAADAGGGEGRGGARAQSERKRRIVNSAVSVFTPATRAAIIASHVPHPHPIPLHLNLTRHPLIDTSCCCSLPMCCRRSEVE